MSFRLFYILLIFAAVKCGEGIWAQEEGLASYYHHRFHGGNHPVEGFMIKKN